MKEQSINMTEGNPRKLILGFSIPLLLGFLFQQFYNMADTLIVGRFVGVNALGAVGSTGSISFLIIGFCMGVCNGFAIPIAQRYGANDMKGLRRFVVNSVWLAAIFAVVMTIVVVILCRPILVLMQTPDTIIDDAYSYIVIIFLGIPVTYLYNLLSAFIRSLGDSKTPVIFLTIAAFLNIILDLLFIIVFHCGVAGAGIATVLSQLVSGICCLIYIIKKFEVLNISKREWKFSPHHAKILCGMGIPMGLQYSITAIGSIILQTAINMLGDVAVAAVTTAGKIYSIFCCPFDALGSTMATYSGQNVGGKKMDRIDEGMKSAIIIGLIYSIIAFVLLATIGKPLSHLFINETDELVINNPIIYDYTYRMILTTTAFYFPLALVNIVRFTIQGMGFSNFAILAGVCEMIARTAVAFILVPIVGFTGICFASPAAWIAADAFLIPAYKIVTKKLRIHFNLV